MPLLAILATSSLLRAAPVSEPRYYEPAAWTVPANATAEEAERSRIQQHLKVVEATLRAQTPADLTKAQRSARLRAMDALHTYWQRGRFPINRDAPRRTPVFIDADGTPCAMGHLIIASGAEDLAREIATYENNDFVADIDHPDLSAWLDANGLTAEEAGWVQPRYDACGFGFVGGGTVCGADGRTYACAAAADCAGVEIVGEGRCGAGSTTGTGTGTTGSPRRDVVDADEVCEDTTTTGNDSTDDDGGDPVTSGTDSTTTGSSTSSTSSTSSGSSGDVSPSSTSPVEDSTTGGTGQQQGSSGCRMSDTPCEWGWALLFLGWRRRRRSAG